MGRLTDASSGYMGGPAKVTPMDSAWENSTAAHPDTIDRKGRGPGSAGPSGAGQSKDYVPHPERGARHSFGVSEGDQE